MAGRAPRTFRNREPIKTVIITFVAVLAVAAIFAAALFFGLQKNIAYTEDGRLYLDIPWLEEYMDSERAQADLP